MTRLLALSAALALVLAACGSSDSTGSTGSTEGGQPEPATALVGTVWTLESLLADDSTFDPIAGLGGADATLTIDGTTITGSSGCNGFGGAATVEGDRLTVAELASTLIGCEPALANQEQTILAVLNGGPTWSIDGDQLTLVLPDGTGLRYRATAGG